MNGKIGDEAFYWFYYVLTPAEPNQPGELPRAGHPDSCRDG
jgi:hypothetical protein